MTARRDSTDGPEAGSLGGRALLVGAVVFAAAATALLVLTDQEKWLRLGIVAALWAALTGAFLAARYRRQLSDQRDTAAERQEIYELELEREVAARREHELTVEAEARRKAEEASRDDIAALRGELTNLRQTLEGLINGEFMVERYALQAEATRMRSLEGDRSLAMRRDVKHLPAANVVVPPVVRDAETDLIERVREAAHQKPRREQPPARPEPRVADSRPPSVPRQPERPPRPERPTPEPVKAKPTPPPPAPRYEHPAEMSDRWFMPDGLANGAPPPQPPRRSEQPRRQEPQRPAEPAPTPAPAPRRPSNWDTGEREWGPSWDQQQPRQPVQNAGGPVGMTAEQTSWLAQYNKPQNSPEPTYGSRAYVPKGARPEQPSQRNMNPAGQRNIDPASQRNMNPVGQRNIDPASQRNMNPVGQRNIDPISQRNMNPVGQRNIDPASQRNISPVSQRNIEPVSQPVSQRDMEPVNHRHRVAEEDTGGGRRRRAEGQPSWQETVGHRAEESSGSHASGRSVSELLANHGLDSSPRRRRRRED
jgi:hypothetical protein